MRLSKQPASCGHVRMQRQPAESMGRLCQLGEHQLAMASQPACSAALVGRAKLAETFLSSD